MQSQNVSCVYCSAIDIKEREVIGNDLAWTFPTNIPITEGHLLIAPRRCVARFDQMSVDEKTAVFELTERVMEALRKSHDAEGFNVAWNEGKLAGQNVPHFHLHVIPRKEGDTGLQEFDLRSMLYRTGDRDISPQDELLSVRNRIREYL